MFAQTPNPPYYAVVFTSQRTDGDRGYDQTAVRMLELARQQAGFLGAESVRSEGFGITVSYWESEASIAEWKRHTEHRAARETGKAIWYADFVVRVCKVERAYGTIFRQSELYQDPKNLENL
ncbi:antibiotic biosynthesis monooxygenase [Neisseria canis]|nr:hypothetical protein AKG43_00495 [Neisseria sp. 74A18]OSI09035.1 antibiotic biosynthesis monooxygenase [Neisseria animaloris]OSI13514.1 antibiotic biosynthesis monooxygenase [Neisseria canis]